MAFTIDESFLPATLTSQPLADDQFVKFCAKHPDFFFEMTSDAEIVVLPLSDFLTGVRNSAIGRQLTAWAQKDARGVVADSSTSFVLPNSARRSADASWTAKSKIRSLPAKSRSGFLHACPDFVIELKSHSDRLKVLRSKMREWIANGAQLAWLIDPETRTVEIYRPDQEPQLLNNANSLTAESPVEGFILDLARVWNPLGE